MRNKTKVINIGNVKIGRGNPIAIQSMTNAKNIDDIINQINLLSDSGCEIIRCAVADFEMAQSLKIIKRNIKIPLVADIHFDYRLAIEAIKNGADKIRINPGNIGSNDRVKLILDTAKQYQIPIRIGVNAGSLEKSILKKYNGVTMQGLAQSALNFIDMFNAYDFDNIVVSVKSSSVPLSIGAYKILSENTDYPLHVGITEAGINTVKSSVGLGAILSIGIGDTIRVSLTDNPLNEVECAKEILSALELRKFGIEFISCPTCARTQIDLIKIASQVKERCKNIQKNIKVAVMGCAVNGPGEAKDAHIGIAGGKNAGFIFKDGVIIKKVREQDIVDELINQINLL
jgi:1-hydroxy-2-methyl-2-(E)-butenyl 4-diphosphate synthase